MAFVLKHNPRAVGQVMRGPAINAVLRAKAERVKAAAGDGMEVTEAGDSKRARYVIVTATPEAMAGEMKDRRLTRAIDAARG